MHETSDLESTRNFKCDFLSKTYRQHDLLAIGRDVAEICISIAESSFPHYSYRMNTDRGTFVIFSQTFVDKT